MATESGREIARIFIADLEGYFCYRFLCFLKQMLCMLHFQSLQIVENCFTYLLLEQMHQLGFIDASFAREPVYGGRIKKIFIERFANNGDPLCIALAKPDKPTFLTLFTLA